MASELQTEDSLVKNFITVSQKSGGLGYSRINSNQVNQEYLLVPSIIRERIINHSVNKEKFDEIIKEVYHGDSEKAFSEFLSVLHAAVYIKAKSVSLALRENRLRFCDRDFTLFFNSQSILNTKNEANHWGVVQQFHYPIHLTRVKTSFIPDLCFFVNGIMFSYSELKHINKNQSSEVEGRKKIIDNYISTVSHCYKEGLFSKQGVKKYDKKDVLKLFESMIHITSFDLSSMHILRGICQFRHPLKEFYDKKGLIPSEIVQKIEKRFMKVPQETNDFKGLKEAFCSIYSPENIRNEILYYNFTEHGNGPVFSPRPKQKYGVDKTISHIDYLYKNESNPDLIKEELKEILREHDVNEEEFENILEDREILNKNQKVFSILLQYAAGFGKTNIMCWLALRMKDMLDENGNYLFNKIFLISDRVDLKRQMDSAMQNMHIHEKLYHVAQKSKDFKEALSDETSRIVIVNIQKFNFLDADRGLPKEVKDQLKDFRTAFIIDEIHRSNTGKQHNEMQNLFEKVEKVKSSKKNLVIGLTATPSDEVLKRFGEVKKEFHGHFEFRPFDAYTMKEAIRDGFVLDPTKGIVRVTKKLFYKTLNSKDDNKYREPTKNEVYNDRELIKLNSIFIAKMLVTLTYPKMSNQGKAMLACKSIEAAQYYFEHLKKELHKLTHNEDNKYNANRFKDSGVYIVYTKPASGTTCEELMDGKSEEQIIKEFTDKRTKNGIMIVVDKLQTGFDEPRLQSLFLDKEVKGINAVQTLSRVNRTFPGKYDCHVFDLSIDNVNVDNINSAFKKYEGMTFEIVNPTKLLSNLEKDYNAIRKNALYKKIETYSNDNSGMDLLEEDDGFVQLIKASPKLEKENFLQMASNYLSSLRSADGIVVDLPNKYKNPEIFKIIKSIRIIINQLRKEDENNALKIEFDFDLIDAPEIFNKETEEFLAEDKKRDRERKSENDGRRKAYKKKELDIITSINNHNKSEDVKESEIEAYKKLIETMFERVIEYSTAKIDKMIKGQKTDRFKIQEEYNKTIKRLGRKCKKEFPENFFEMIEPLKEYYFEEFVEYVN
jgi:type I restriction enzyme R subunit